MSTTLPYEEVVVHRKTIQIYRQSAPAVEATAKIPSNGNKFKLALTARNPHKRLGIFPDTRIPIYIIGQRCMFDAEIMNMIDEGDIRGLRAAQSFLEEGRHTLLLERQAVNAIVPIIDGKLLTIHINTSGAVNGYVTGKVGISGPGFFIVLDAA